ncbi:MAG: diacylglycerol kinase family lipid kinase [Firmicutes bacterium]|nr:diacylglycerol kinase family lipid kinase [Bacillota bacterium]
MKHVFVVNPAAGNGAALRDILPAIHKALTGFEDDYEIHRTMSEQETILYCRQKCAFEGRVRFYACGGDGTINNVLSGIAGHDNAELAIIPCGTGNDFVRNFTQKDNFLNIEKQIQGSAIPIDVLKWQGGYALNMFNIGVDCDVVAEAAAMKSDRLKGTAAYLAAAFKVLRKGKTYRMAYAAEDGEEQEAELMLAAIANGHFCGGGFQSCPAARLDDGFMDVCVVRPVKGLKLPILLAKYRSGTHLMDRDADKYIEYIHCKKFRLRALEPVRISVDGEVLDFADTEFEILPGAVRLVIPEGSKPI